VIENYIKMQTGKGFNVILQHPVAMRGSDFWQRFFCLREASAAVDFSLL
jgi:hypothetical protein